jgi:hypothetical protein
METNQFSLRVAARDRYGPMFKTKDVMQMCMNMVLNESFFERHRKDMTTDAEIAIEKTEKVTREFSDSLDRFLAVEKRFADQSKRASGAVRDAGEKLANGLSRIEKAANFDRLDRYVDLLERAATAMTVLAELEASGKLDKIAGAIR